MRRCTRLPPCTTSALRASRHVQGRHQKQRNYATAFPTPAPSNVAQVFNTRQKLLQRSRAALSPDTSRQVDYLRTETGTRLASRLLDIKREYNTVLDYGAGPCTLTSILARPDLEEGTPSPPLSSRIISGPLICADPSSALLHRDASQLAEIERAAFPHGVERLVLSGDETTPLPLADASVDLVLSNSALHWINDLPFVLGELNRVLRPDCALLAAMPGGDTLYELRGSLQLAEQERLGGIKGHVSPLADVRDVGNLLGRAGFKLLTVDVDDIVVTYPDVLSLMRDLNAMGEGNASLRMEPGGIGRDTLLAAEGVYRELYGDEEGNLPATFRTIYMIGWKEGEGQAKPLERGSGEVSIKDILEGKK